MNLLRRRTRDTLLHAHERAVERFRHRAEETARDALLPVVPPGSPYPDPEIAAILEPIETAPIEGLIWMVAETRKNYYGQRPLPGDLRRIRWWLPQRRQSHLHEER